MAEGDTMVQSINPNLDENECPDRCSRCGYIPTLYRKVISTKLYIYGNKEHVNLIFNERLIDRLEDAPYLQEIVDRFKDSEECWVECECGLKTGVYNSIENALLHWNKIEVKTLESINQPVVDKPEYTPAQKELIRVTGGDYCRLDNKFCPMCQDVGFVKSWESCSINWAHLKRGRRC